MRKFYVRFENDSEGAALEIRAPSRIEAVKKYFNLFSGYPNTAKIVIVSSRDKGYKVLKTYFARHVAEVKEV